MELEEKEQSAIKYGGKIMNELKEEMPPVKQGTYGNEACQVIELWHYEQYAPGYVVKVISDHGRHGTFEAQYWVHEHQQQMDLLAALQNVSVDIRISRRRVITPHA